MRFIKVWCEYDIGGSFGGNNNESAYIIDDNLGEDIVNDLVLKHLLNCTGLDEEELEGLYDWERLSISKLS